VDFVVSAGVFQHITAFAVISSYIREGLRVSKPGGLVLFQFEATRSAEVGLGQVGARITAPALDAALEDSSFRIREVSTDSRDPIRNVVCVLERTVEPSTDRFESYPMTQRAWLHGIYEGVSTDTEIQERLATPQLPLTFYER
jgi:cyclopropane fatty-acyl-phospholipid synthase-like methyltransferase